MCSYKSTFLAEIPSVEKLKFEVKKDKKYYLAEKKLRYQRMGRKWTGICDGKLNRANA